MSNAQNFLLKILAVGPIPQALPNHVASVMDGNRLYARINHKKDIVMRRELLGSTDPAATNVIVILIHNYSDVGNLLEIEHKMCLCLHVFH